MFRNLISFSEEFKDAMYIFMLLFRDVVGFLLVVKVIVGLYVCGDETWFIHCRCQLNSILDISPHVVHPHFETFRGSLHFSFPHFP